MSNPITTLKDAQEFRENSEEIYSYISSQIKNIKEDQSETAIRESLKTISNGISERGGSAKIAGEVGKKAFTCS